MNKLSKRMQAVAALVQNTTCLADVGCDHGYVPIYLIQSECPMDLRHWLHLKPMAW